MFPPISKSRAFQVSVVFGVISSVVALVLPFQASVLLAFSYSTIGHLLSSLTFCAIAGSLKALCIHAIAICFQPSLRLQAIIVSGGALSLIEGWVYYKFLDTSFLFGR